MQVYLVGGAVRDELLGRVIKECDYVIVGATSEQLLKQGYQQVGKDFPVFLHPQTKDEYALARTERKQGKGYTGFVCEFSPDVTLEDDLRRRDLTVNAIAKAEDGSLIDPYHGKRDLDARILRHVSQAFSEDPLRILRIARFAARYHYLGFTIAKETQSLLKAMVERGELNTLTPERIWLECEKSLTDGAFDHFLNTLAHLNALSVISPALANIWNDQLFQKLQARFEYAKKYNITDNALLFSQTTSKLNSDEISAIAKAIRLPNDVRDLALHASQHQDVLTSATIHPEQLLFSCNKLDLWRRPERFSAVLKAIEIANCSVIKNQQLLLQASKEARAINPKQFIDQGIKGADIKTALEHARLEVFKRYFR